MSICSVAVIGGGIAGLAAAWELSLSAEVRVVVLEAAERLGGKVMTDEFGGRRVDVGPDAFVARRPEAVGLCFELGLAQELVAPSSGRAYIWRRNRLRSLPDGLVLGVPTRIGPLASSGICSLKGLRRPAIDLIAPALVHRRNGTSVDDSIGEIVRARLGHEVHDLLADPLIGGINAGSIDTMSAAAVFPQLLNASRSMGSLMRSLRQTRSGEGPVFLGFRQGMWRLVERLAEALRERGTEIRTRVAVERIERTNPTGVGGWKLSGSYENETIEADGVVLALGAQGASSLLGPHDRELSALLGSIPSSSVTLVTLRFPPAAVGRALDGSGFLIPVVEGRLVTACTWLSSKWAHLGESGDILLRASTGRYGDERAASMSDEELVEACIGELSQMLGLRGDPLDAMVTRWPEAFPQYLVGHPSRVREIESRTARLRSVAVAGAPMEGVGLPACIGSGRKAARALLEHLVPVAT